MRMAIDYQSLRFLTLALEYYGHPKNSVLPESSTLNKSSRNTEPSPENDRMHHDT